LAVKGFVVEGLDVAVTQVGRVIIVIGFLRLLFLLLLLLRDDLLAQFGIGEAITIFFFGNELLLLDCDTGIDCFDSALGKHGQLALSLHQHLILELLRRGQCVPFGPIRWDDVKLVAEDSMQDLCHLELEGRTAMEFEGDDHGVRAPEEAELLDGTDDVPEVDL
jgi:hypothetical protein